MVTDNSLKVKDLHLAYREYFLKRAGEKLDDKNLVQIMEGIGCKFTVAERRALKEGVICLSVLD